MSTYNAIRYNNPYANAGSLILLSTQTASASASLEFSMDSSYDSYIFKFINIHPATDNVDFEFQGSTDSGSTYATTMTTTAFRSTHDEADTSAELGYRTGEDQAQGTSFQDLCIGMGADADQSLNGMLQIYNPSSTTFVKHFIARTQEPKANDYHVDWFCAGYFNTTSAITNLKFQMSSGNIDDGIIKMYGVS